MFHNSRPCWRSRKEPNPTVFQKTLGLNDFYFGTDDVDYPLGNIQMVGKSQAEMYRGEKPLQTRLAPEWTLDEVARHAVDFWLSTEDLPRPDNRVTLRADGSIALALHARPTTCPSSGCCTSSSRMLEHLGMHHDHLLPRHAYLKNDIPVAGVRPPGRHVPLRDRPGAARCSTPTAARTRSTTSTSSTRASSRASAR